MMQTKQMILYLCIFNNAKNNQQQAEEKLNDDYMYSIDMFFEHMRPVFPEHDDDMQLDIDNIAEITGSMSLDIDDSPLMT